MISSLAPLLSEQNPHWEGGIYGHSVQRLHDKAARRTLSEPDIHFITGIRGAGKSTLLKTLINALVPSHPPHSILYLDLEDPHYINFFDEASVLSKLILHAETLTGHRVEYLLLDNIQAVGQWAKFLKNAYDKEQFKKIWITSSQADLFSREEAALLTGYYRELPVHPLSYQEILLNASITTPIQSGPQKSKAMALLEDMLVWGGFPRIYSLAEKEAKTTVLKYYLEAILFKDCIRHQAIRDTTAFFRLAHYLLSHVGQPYSYNSLKQVLGNNEMTLQQFIGVLKNTEMVEEIMPFVYPFKPSSKMRKKPYCIDNGLLSAATFTLRHHKEILLENFVYSELKKQNNNDIFFFHGARGCDFIVKRSSGWIAIQVCYHWDLVNRDHEIKGLKAAMKHFSISEGFILTYDHEAMVENKLPVIPVWKYFS